MSEELLYNKIYDQTKDFGRTQFVREIVRLQRENQELKERTERIDEAIEYMKGFTFEPLLVNEDRKLIMFNENLREFERILKGEDSNGFMD